MAGTVFRVSLYNGIRRLGVGGFITLTPCVPRYEYLLNYMEKVWKKSKKLANVLAQPDPQLALSNPTRPELAFTKPDPTRARKNQARSHP